MKPILTFLLLSFFATQALANTMCYEYFINTQEIETGILKKENLNNSNIKVGIYKRTESEIKELNTERKLINGAIGNTNTPPSYFPSHVLAPVNLKWAKSGIRSKSKSLFIFFSLETISEDNRYCGIKHYPKIKPANMSMPNLYEYLGKQWPGGFVDHCYAIGYDYTGRPIFSADYGDYKEIEKSSKLNLVVPEYKEENNGVLITVCNKPNK